MATKTSNKVDKLLKAFGSGKVLTVPQIQKLGVRNPSAHVSYLRNHLGYHDIITSRRNNKTFYGFQSAA